MDTQLIESLDRSRYKALFWQTIGFGVMFAGVIAGPYSTRKAAIIILAITTGFGCGLFLAATLKSNRLQRRIKSDPALHGALNNELIRLYGYKSLMWAFYSTLVAAAILFFISSWWLTSLGASLACLILIYTACLSLMISRLVYLKK